MTFIRLISVAVFGVLIVADRANAQTRSAADEERPEVRQEKLSRRFVEEKPKAFSQCAIYGRAFVGGNRAKGAEEFVIPLLSDPDSRIRCAAVSALDAMGLMDPRYIPLLRIALVDSDVRVRTAAAIAIPHLFEHDLGLFSALVDAALWDRDRTVKKQCFESLVTQLRTIENGQDGRSSAELSDLVSRLENQPHLGDDAGDGKQVGAVIESIRSALSVMKREKEGAAKNIGFLRWVLVGYGNLSQSWQEGVPIIGLVVLVQLYYLILFVVSPSTLFGFLYSSYPILIVPYVFAPTLYRKTLRPALAFLRRVTNPRRPATPRQLHLVNNFWTAAWSLSPQKKDRLSIAIADWIAKVKDEELLNVLYRVLSEIDQRRAVSVMDLVPENREITEARKNMNRIIDLPDGPFAREGFELGHRITQATSISADFYSVIPRGDETYAVYMVDVNGHGLAASLQALQVSLMLKAATGWGMGRPRHELEMADELLRQGDSRLLVTMNFLEVDLRKNKVRYANAGMPPAFLFSRNHSEPTRLVAVGMYVGGGYSFVSPQPAEVSADISPGDVIVLCSDGILEAHGADNHPFGENRLIAAVKSNRRSAPEDLVKEIMTACQTYTGRAKPIDDQSVIVIRIPDEVGGKETATNVIASSLSVLALEDRSVKVTLRRSGDWPAVVTQFLEKTALPFVRSNVKSAEMHRRFYVAVREALENALRHGADYNESVSVSVTQLSADSVEVVITQPRDWPMWDVSLGAQTQKRLREFIEAIRHGRPAQPVLGGTVLISDYADGIVCVNKGRRLTLRFLDRSVHAVRDEVAYARA